MLAMFSRFYPNRALLFSFLFLLITGSVPLEGSSLTVEQGLRLSYRLSLIPANDTSMARIVVEGAGPNSSSLFFEDAFINVAIGKGFLNLTVSMYNGSYGYVRWGSELYPRAVVLGGPQDFSYSRSYLLSSSGALYTLEGYWAGFSPYVARVDPGKPVVSVFGINTGKVRPVCRLPAEMEGLVSLVSEGIGVEVGYEELGPGESLTVRLGSGNITIGSLPEAPPIIVIVGCFDLSLILSHLDPGLLVSSVVAGDSVIGSGEVVNGSIVFGHAVGSLGMANFTLRLGEGLYLASDPARGYALLGARGDIVYPGFRGRVEEMLGRDAGYIIFVSVPVVLPYESWVAYHARGFLVGSVVVSKAQMAPMLDFFLRSFLTPTFDLSGDVRVDVFNASGIRVELVGVEGLEEAGGLELSGSPYRPSAWILAAPLLLSLALLAAASYGRLRGRGA